MPSQRESITTQGGQKSKLFTFADGTESPLCGLKRTLFRSQCARKNTGFIVSVSACETAHLTDFLEQVDFKWNRHKSAELCEIGQPVIVVLAVEVWIGDVVHPTRGCVVSLWAAAGRGQWRFLRCLVQLRRGYL